MGSGHDSDYNKFGEKEMKRGKSRTVIWNTASRHHMYSRLKSEFGLCHTWKSESPPGYSKFLKDYAEKIGAASPQAVAHQIRFTVSACKMKKGVSNYWNQCQARTGIGNLNAALEAGFIRQRDLPDLIVQAGSRKGPKAGKDIQPDLWENGGKEPKVDMDVDFDEEIRILMLEGGIGYPEAVKELYRQMGAKK